MEELPLPLHSLPARINRLFLAFSGGVDSVALLHSLLRYRRDYQIILWHINHGLQQASAEMERFSCDEASRNDLEIRVDHLDMNASSSNLEARARRYRYELFASVLTANDALLTAHHANDQAETLLLNLMRGSGPSGLRAIARQKPLGEGILFRPLLDFSREDIVGFAKGHSLQWIEDPSNASPKFDRNYIRHKVIPTLLQRWPSAVSQIHRACDWQNESYALARELAQLDYAVVKSQQPFSHYRNLSVGALTRLSQERQKNLIRYWLKHQRKPVIGHKKINQLLVQSSSQEGANPVVEGDGYSIRIYQQHLYIVDHFVVPVLQSEYNFANNQSVDIPAINLRQTRKNIFNKMQVDDEGQALSLCFRARNQTNLEFSHRMKHLFQRHRIPPWIRGMTPMIALDGKPLGLWLF